MKFNFCYNEFGLKISQKISENINVIQNDLYMYLRLYEIFNLFVLNLQINYNYFIRLPFKFQNDRIKWSREIARYQRMSQTKLHHQRIHEFAK